jgi:hypothetical protein
MTIKNEVVNPGPVSQTSQEDLHRDCHDVVCNASRKHSRGAASIGCSCRGRDVAYVELQQALATIQRLEQEYGALRVKYFDALERAELAERHLTDTKLLADANLEEAQATIPHLQALVDEAVSTADRRGSNRRCRLQAGPARAATIRRNPSWVNSADLQKVLAALLSAFKG